MSKAIFLANGEIANLSVVPVFAIGVLATEVLTSGFTSVIFAVSPTLAPPLIIAETSVPAGPIIANILSTGAASPSATPW